LDGVQRLQKGVLFEHFYELWTTNGLISERIATRQFEEQNQFIVEAILDIFDEEKYILLP